MNCRKCGNLLNENDPICRLCGEPVNIGTPITNQTNQGTTNQGYANGAQMPTQPMNSQPSVNQQVQPATNQQAQPVINQQAPVQPMMNQNYGTQVAPTQMPNPNNYNNGQTPMPMNQNYGNMVPPINNGLASNPMPQNTKNSNKGFIIILIILIFIIASLGGFIAYKAINDKPDREINNNPEDQNNPETPNSEDDDDEEEEEKPSNKNTHLLNGFTFILPEGLMYNKTNDSITATDSISSPSIYFNFYVENYSYATALAGINDILNEFTTAGITVLNHGKIKYSNTEFYVFIISQDGNAGISYLASLDTTHSTSGITMGATEQNIDTAFEKIAYIIENSSKVEEFAPGETEDKYTGLKGKDEFKNQTIQGATYTIK